MSQIPPVLGTGLSMILTGHARARDSKLSTIQEHFWHGVSWELSSKWQSNLTVTWPITYLVHGWSSVIIFIHQPVRQHLIRNRISWRPVTYLVYPYSILFTPREESQKTKMPHNVLLYSSEWQIGHLHLHWAFAVLQQAFWICMANYYIASFFFRVANHIILGASCYMVENIDILYI